MSTRADTDVGPAGSAVASELTAVLTVGGVPGAYAVKNPYGGDLAELLIHAVTGVGATTFAVLDLYSALTSPGANPTIPGAAPLRGLVFSGSSAGSGATTYAPIVTVGETDVLFTVVTGTAVYLVYQWRRIVPNPGANLVNRSLDAAKALLDAASAACGNDANDCPCAVHRAVGRYLGDSKLGERV